MFSLFLREKLYIGEACWAFIFGVVIGPYGANFFNPRGWTSSESSVNTITLEVTRIVLAIGVFAIGVELPKQYMKKHWRSLFFLLVPIMTWIINYGWFVSAGLIFALIPGLSFLSSLAVGACLTPTDPILAAAVIGGKYADKHVPAHLRHHEVVLGVVFGSVVGYGFRHLMRFCERKDLIDRKSYVAQYVALALFSVGSTTLLGSDDLLSAFASGTAFAWDGFFNKQTEDSAFSSVIDLLFNIAAFIYIGAWMPFHLFTSAALTLSVWRLIVLAILILILRRLPVMLALYRWIPDVKTFREAVFSGHFGPIGVGAVFISTLAVGQLPPAHDPPRNQVELLAASIQPIVAFMVLCSITVHGLSIPFFSLSRRVHSVSRTWSRHQSTDLGGPEWATQTRRVNGPEDIVINRDRDAAANVMELGQSEKVESDAATTVGGGDRGEIDNNLGGEPTSRDENPPDGFARDGNRTEWREGPHLVVEHSHGPGDEVDVEVRRDVAGEEERSGPVQTFHGLEADVQQEVEKHLNHLKDMPANIEHEAARELGEIKEGAAHLRDETVNILRHAGDTLTPRHDGDEDLREREEDWDDIEDEDEDEENTRGRPLTTERSGKPLHRPRRPKVRLISTKLPRHGSGQSKTQPTTPISASISLDDEDKEEEEPARGRDMSRSRSVGDLHATGRGQSKLANLRPAHAAKGFVSRLKREEAHRASSPARSIRFADQQPPPSA
ncbi:hypothetical protein Clacol_007544 [Clathrus columnatus]|uniref:Cation/H+ exchanger transmembrane domain-containing protein n=1 Tax=Clathrus columnatus TaxID=1419009 RepID=A0AAV5AF80_9AGAM|nr:hypothetical protein Clacol_007544 [Clathrus columnatus]